jgi:hypothetical protein
MSKHKVFLKLLTYLTMAGAGLSLFLSIVVGLNAVEARSFQPLALIASFFALLAWFPTVLLVGEYADSRRAGESWWRRYRGLKLVELKELTSYCPMMIKVLALICAGVGFIQLLFIGSISWVSGKELSPAEIQGLFAGAAVFLSLSVPVITSSARMPGRLSELKRNYRGPSEAHR